MDNVIDKPQSLTADNSKDLTPGALKDTGPAKDERKPDEPKQEEHRGLLDDKKDWWEKDKAPEKDTGRDQSTSLFGNEKAEKKEEKAPEAAKAEEGKDKAQEKGQEVKSVAAGEVKPEATKEAKAEQGAEKVQEVRQERGGMPHTAAPGEQMERALNGDKAVEASEREASKVREQDRPRTQADQAKAPEQAEQKQAKQAEIKPEAENKAMEVSKNSRGQEFLVELCGSKDQRDALKESRERGNEQKQDKNQEKSRENKRGMALGM